MKILHVVHQFMPERVGGTEIYTLGLSRGLLERGYEVAIFHRVPGSPGLTQTVWDGVPVYRAAAGHMTPWTVFRATFGNRHLERAFSKTLSDFDPDLVHVQHLMGLPASLVSEAWRRRYPLLLTLHDYWFICANAQLLTNYDSTVCAGPALGGVNCGRCALARAEAPYLWPLSPALQPLFVRRRRMLRRILDHFRWIISPSRFLVQKITEWGAPVERLLNLPNGIDIGGALPRAGRSQPAGPVRVAYIGGLASQKGVHVLIDAFNGLDRDATLEIYGDLGQFPDYVDSLRKSVQSPRISFGGRLDRVGVWRTLSEIDALVMPSLWYENAPVVIQEARAAGVPVVASDLGAITEWLRDGVDSLLAPPGDVSAWRAALQRLVDEPDLLPRLRANIPAPMTVDGHLGRLESLYAQLIETAE